MKTPRELLLARHRSAMPRLDVVRRRVLLEYVTGPASHPAEPTPAAAVLVDLWRELFWTCRRAWLALALAWLVILSLNLAEPPTQAESATPASAGPARDWRTAMAEQARLRAELLSSETAPVAETYPRRPPGPRSEGPPSPEPPDRLVPLAV